MLMAWLIPVCAWLPCAIYHVLELVIDLLINRYVWLYSEMCGLTDRAQAGAM